MPNIFNPSEIEQFVEEGYVAVREAFPSDVAAAIRTSLWEKLGRDPHPTGGFAEPFVSLQKAFTEPPFCEAWSPRVLAALDELVGAGRYLVPRALGWFPVSFPGFDQAPWKPPTENWHVDGIQFHHHIDSRDQGLLPIFILSDIGPGDGGTAIDLGSHKITARVLADAEPDGLDLRELCKRVAAHPLGKIVEATGRAGDLFLNHPFMRHARSPNTGTSVRFICNPCIILHEPMNLKRDDPSGYSPVEAAIVRALGEKSLDGAPAGP
jgi:hypothetical protein